MDLDSKNLAKGQIKINNSETERGEAGVALVKSTAPKVPQKSNLAMAGGTIMSEEKNPNKNSLLKKKTDANMT